MLTTRRTLRTALTLAAAALALGMTGCKTAPAAEPEVTMDQLISEARDLRARNSQVEDALDESERIRASLESERDSLTGENGRLRAQLDSANQRPDTGFDGIAGAEVSIRGGEIVVEIAGDVLFSSGKASLRDDSKSTLDQVASAINRRYPSSEVRIAGHTDSDPIKKSGWKTNERLAAERAMSVEEYLSTRGVDKDRMHIASYGPARPKASKKASRRVEIIILSAGG